MTIPLARPLPDGSSCLPGPAGARRPCESQPARGPYSALLPVGLAMRVLLPAPRWALTPPFHPCRCGQRRSVLCGAFPGVAPAGRYPAPSPHGVRTFLDDRNRRGHPALRAGPIWPGRGRASMGASSGLIGTTASRIRQTLSLRGVAPPASAVGQRSMKPHRAAIAIRHSLFAIHPTPGRAVVRAAAIIRSSALSGPFAQGRNRSRNAANRVSGSAGG